VYVHRAAPSDLSESFETDVSVTCGVTIHQEQNQLSKLWNSCIRECFVGNYRVKHDSGSHFLSLVKGGRQVPLLLFALTAKVQN
jgi:hypothetical protein